MSDVLITPASSKIEFKDASNNIDGVIKLDTDGNLELTAPNGGISFGDTSSDVFIGNGTDNVDLKFEADGSITGTSGVTLTLGSSGSNISFGTTITSGLNVTGVSTFSSNIVANGNIVGDDSTNISGISSVTATKFFGDLEGDLLNDGKLRLQTTSTGISVFSGGSSPFPLGGVNASTLTGTLQTAAQTNITSVGTLSALTVSGNIAVTGTVDGVDIAALNTTVAGKLSKTGGTMTGNINISNTAPQYVLSESDTTTSARSVVSVGQLFVQCGAAGSSNTTSAGIINLTGYNAIPAAQINLKSDLVTVTGVLTASSFFGDGSGLSNLPGGAGVSTSIGTFTANAGSPSNIDSFAYASNNYKVAEYTLHFTNGSNIQAQKLLVMQDGTNAFSNEYAIMFHSTKLVSVDAVISGSNVLVRATPESGISGITTFRWRREVQE